MVFDSLYFFKGLYFSTSPFDIPGPTWYHIPVKTRRKPMFLYYSLFVALIVIADQVAKYFTVLYIPAAGAQPFIPGILQITYVRNTGAAFSSFEGQQWLFALIFLVLTGLIFWEYFKKPMGFTKLERFCIAAIYGGGLGNMIDRVRLGYVVDMFHFTFWPSYPVFNVADICIVTGAVLGAVYYLWFYEKYDKKGISHGNPDAASQS